MIRIYKHRNGMRRGMLARFWALALAVVPDRSKPGLLCRVAGIAAVILAVALGAGIAAAQGEMDGLKRQLKALQERIDKLVFAPILPSFFRSDRDIDPDPLAFVFVNGS